MKWKSAPRSIGAIALFATMLGSGPGSAEQEKANPAKSPGASGSGSAGAKQAAPATHKAAPAKSTVYVPPPRGAVGARTGGGTRGNADAPRIAVLAPDHIGLTTRAQPALAWYLSSDTRAPAELTVIGDDAVEPLLVMRLPSPLRAGIHVIDLSQQKVQLQPDATYDWYVALVLDPDARDADVVAGGAIQRRATASELAADLAAGEPSYRVYARHGIWYDAIADLSKAVDAVPDDTAAGRELRAERAALLEQVGVGAVALYEREGAGGPSDRK